MTYEEVFAVFGLLYSRIGENDYTTIEDAATWQDFIASCHALTAVPDIDALAATASEMLAAPLPYSRYRSFKNAILTPGIPGSVLPVESLYKPWSTIIKDGIGSNTGFYMGDHAHHIIALCDTLHIAIPAEFSAMPDHLTLLLELFTFLQAHASRTATQEFVDNHLDWLPSYGEALTERELLEPDETLAQSIRFYRELTGLLAIVIECATREGDEIGNE